MQSFICFRQHTVNEKVLFAASYKLIEASVVYLKCSLLCSLAGTYKFREYIYLRSFLSP